MTQPQTPATSRSGQAVAPQTPGGKTSAYITDESKCDYIFYTVREEISNKVIAVLIETKTSNWLKTCRNWLQLCNNCLQPCCNWLPVCSNCLQPCRMYEVMTCIIMYCGADMHRTERVNKEIAIQYTSEEGRCFLTELQVHCCHGF